MAPSNKNVTIRSDDNLFTVLNSELKWLHTRVEDAMEESNANNMKVFWHRIVAIQDAVLKALDKGLTEDVKKEIKDLQDAMADVLLTGQDNGGSKS